jgi:hypothetical protein
MIYGAIRTARECPNLLLLNIGIWGLLWLAALDATIFRAMESDYKNGTSGFISAWGKYVFTSRGVVVQLGIVIVLSCIVLFAICRGAYQQLKGENQPPAG